MIRKSCLNTTTLMFIIVFAFIAKESLAQIYYDTYSPYYSAYNYGYPYYSYPYTYYNIGKRNAGFNHNKGKNVTPQNNQQTQFDSYESTTTTIN